MRKEDTDGFLCTDQVELHPPGVSFKEAVRLWHEGIPFASSENSDEQAVGRAAFSIARPDHEESRKKPQHVAFMNAQSKKIALALQGHTFSLREQFTILYNSLLSDAPSKRDALDTLRLIMAELFGGSLGAYDKYLSKQKGEKYDIFWQKAAGFTARNHRRRPGAVPWDGVSSHENSTKMIQAVLDFGVTNVATNANSYFLAIIELFYEQHGKDGTPEEYEAIAHSVLPILQIMASCHDDIFHAALSVFQRHEVIEDVDSCSLRKEKRERTFFPRPVLADDFVLNENHLELKPSVVEAVRERVWRLFKNGHIELFEPRTGCPGMSLFPLIFKETLRVAKETLFARPAHFRTLPRQVSENPEYITPANLALRLESLRPEIQKFLPQKSRLILPFNRAEVENQ